MKKITAKHAASVFAVIVLTAALLAGCGASGTPQDGRAAPSESSGTKVNDILKRVMPAQMEDGAVKVAVVRNLTNSDHTRLFLSGCILEGTALGFQVDTFITDGDNARCQAVIAEVIEGDYDGIILSHGGGYTYDALLPAAAKGMKVVTFDSVPYKGGDIRNAILEGCTSTAQEDYMLAEQSLNSLVTYFSHAPVKVIRTWMGPDIPPMDMRAVVFDRFVAEGKIEEVSVIDPADYSDPRGGAEEALAAMLPDYPAGTVDAIWGSYDELAKGCLDALNAAGRDDIKIMSIDISDNNINMMLDNDDVWISTAAVDPKLIGIVNIRLLAAKFAGEDTPDTFNLDAQLIETSALDHSTNMSNIDRVVENWGREKGLFDHYPWMAELKALTYSY